jgi:F-type H+-transporting ATPase subunit gamma
MANLQEVRERIGSVVTTQQITKAMKLVAASKLKRAQDRITEMRPYSNKLYSILQNILSNIDTEELNLNFSKEREVKKVLIVLFTSDKGLCGGFNANLNKKVRTLVNETYKDLVAEGNVTLMPVGKKGRDFFKNYPTLKVNDSYINLFHNIAFEEASEAAQLVMDGFLNGTFDKVHVVYSEFKNAATQVFTVDQFLPIAELEKAEGDSNVNADFIFEPEKASLINELIPKILKTQFFRYLLDNNASEHGARMVAMDQATENANELLNSLKLQYNRERQAAITKEILEIVGGAAALEEG